MSCPNCHLFHSKCKAGCCGMVPIDRDIFNKNFHLIQKPIKDSIIQGPTILPITEDLTCPFLSAEFKCMIYTIRPEVCKKFGDETDTLMTCRYQKANGQRRSKKETEKIDKLTENKFQTYKK